MDYAAAIDRAVKLLDRPLRQAVGPGELDIPAVLGLGGSLACFVDRRSGLDRLSDADFEPVADGGTDWIVVRLTAFDHPSQSMQYEEMLIWVLFYLSRRKGGYRRRAEDVAAKGAWSSYSDRSRMEAPKRSGWDDPGRPRYGVGNNRGRSFRSR